MARIIGRIPSGGQQTDVSSANETSLTATPAKKQEEQAAGPTLPLTISPPKPQRIGPNATSFARFPRPRSRLLPSGVGNLLSHLPTNTLAYKASPVEYVASTSSPLLDSEEGLHITAPFNLPPVSQLTLTKPGPLEISTRDLDANHDADADLTITAVSDSTGDSSHLQRDVLSMLDDATPPPGSYHRRNQSESQLPGLYNHSSRSVRDIATVFEACKTSSSSPDLVAEHDATTSPSAASSSSPLLSPHRKPVRYRAFPVRNESYESLNCSSAASSPVASMFSPGLSSSAEWVHSPLSPYPDSPSSDPNLRGHKSAYEAPFTSWQDEGTARPRPGRMLTDYTMATSVSSSDDGSDTPLASDVQLKQRLADAQPRPASPLKARALIDMFEQNDAEQGGKDVQPVVHYRVSPEEASRSTMSPRKALLAYTPAHSSLADTVRAPSPRRLQSATPLGERNIQHHPEMSDQPSITRSLEHRRALSQDIVVSPASPSPQAGASLPLSDLVPSATTSARQHLAAKLSPDRRSGTSAARLTPSTSMRRSHESGDLPLSTEAAQAMLDPSTDSPPLQAGRVWYYAVSPTDPRTAQWVRAQAILLPSALALSWIPRGGGRENIVLELRRCQSVHSLPSIDHDASSDDAGAQQAKGQGLASIKPLQFVFEDGVERLALDSIKERSTWVLAAREALSGQAPFSAPPMSKQPSQLERIGGALGRSSSGMQSGKTASFDGPPVPPKEGSSSTDSPLITQEVPSARPQRVSTIGWRAQSLRPSVDEVTPLSAEIPDDTIIQHGSDAQPSAEEATPLVRSVPGHLRPPSVAEHDVRRVSGSDFTFGGHELFPSDSASQRPPMSDADDERVELPEQLHSLRHPTRGLYSPGDIVTGPHSPVQAIGNVAPPTSPQMRSAVRTPAQVFRDQVLGSPAGSVRDEHPPESTAASARRLGTVVEETRSQAAAEGASVQRSHGASSEVAKVLTYLEKEKESRLSRDKQLEDQLLTLQETISSLSAKRSPSKAASRQASDAQVRAVEADAKKDGSATSFQGIQEQLGKVLELVSKVSHGHEADKEARSVTHSELGRIGKGVDELLARVQRRRASSSTSQNKSQQSKSHVASVYADADETRSEATVSSMSFATPTPRRAWDSVAGIAAAAPPPSPKAKSSSSVHSTKSRQNADGFEHLAAWQEHISRPSSPAKKSEATLDMEAAIRQRRADQMAGVSTAYPENAQGGWYSPKKPASVSQHQKSVSDLGPASGTRARSILAHMPSAQPLHDNGVKQADGSAGPTRGPDVLAKTAAEITSVLSTLKQDEESRKMQQKQQSDIAGYLNELNGWLHTDGQERASNFKTLSQGVSKLAEEVAALKTSGAVSASQPTPGPELYPPQTMGNQPHPYGTAPPVQTSREVPIVDGAAPDGQAQPDSWPFRKPSSSGQPPVPTPNPQAEEARSAMLNAAEDEVARHFASMERTGQTPPADGGTAAMSEKSVSQLGEAAGKKNVRSVRKIIRELAAAGAGATALKFLKDHFHKERSREEAESHVPPAPAKEAPEVVSKDAGNTSADKAKPKKTSRRSKDASHPLLETALNAAKEGNLKDALGALKEGHLMGALHAMQSKKRNDSDEAAGDTSMESTSSSGSGGGSGGHLHHLKEGLMGAASGAVIAFAIEELIKHLHERKEEEKVAKLEQEKREAEREAARAEADKAREEKLFEMQQKHATAIIEALNEVIKEERRVREEASAAKSQELDPKTAIEALVKALNETRLEEAAKRAQTDAAIATLATEVIKQTGSQHEHLLMTLAAMSKDLVKNGIDHHLHSFKGAMAASFAGSAQAMADAWKSHAKEATASAASGPKAIEAPAAAPAPAPAPAAAAPKPSPPPRRRGGRTGPYGVTVG